MISWLAKAGRLGITTLALVYASCGAAPVAHEAVDGTTDALNATVGLVNREGRPYCAGVFVEHYVVTAQHCVDSGTQLRVGLYKDYNGKAWSRSIPFTVIYNDSVQDLAVLLPAEILPADSYSSVRLSDSPPTRGQRVVIIGHPLGLAYSVGDGIVAHPERDLGPYTEMIWFQISAPVSPGNSGGPVLNRWGELLGIVSFRMVSRQGAESHLGGAVHWLSIKRALDSAT